MIAAIPPVLHPADATDIDVAEVGGKGAALMRLAAAGFDVPDFFVITATTCRQARDGAVDAVLATAIEAALQRLGGPAESYAVRSSGLAEDSTDASFAGVFDTVLDVSGMPSIVAAIEHCWSSSRSAHAEAYRAARKIDDLPSMAVVVQRLVRAEWAGVSFSADPLSQALSVAVINASPGLGEDLVSGRVTPVQIRLDALSGKVLAVDRPPSIPEFPAGYTQDVAIVTRRIADAFQFPQDVEWAISDGRVFVLQSRPITTIAGVFHNRALEPWAGMGGPDDPGRTWTRAYADEIWTPPVTPLFYDIQNLTAVTAGRIRNDGDDAPLPPDIFKYYRAAPYIDVDVLCRLYAGLPRLARRDSVLSMVPAQQARALAAARWRRSAWLRRAWRFEVTGGRHHGLWRCHRYLDRHWPAFIDQANALHERDLSQLDDPGLDAHILGIWRLAGSVGPECETAVLYHAHDLKLLLTGLLDRWCGGGEALYGDVSAGLAGSETVRESDAIWSIAASIRQAGPAAVEFARDRTWAQYRDGAAPARIPSVVHAVDEFLASHRHRGANYKDLIHPRWGDDPDLLWAHVRAFVDTPGKSPREANGAAASRREQSQRRALAGMTGAVAPVRRAILRQLFRLNEIYAGIRDNHRFYYDHVWYLVRLAYQEIGRRLAGRGSLASAEDVWFLGRHEIDALRNGDLHCALAAERIAVRRREWLQTRISQPPKFLRAGYVGDDTTRPPESARTWHGLAASAGQARGRARILFDVTDLARIEPGEILVTRQTDPGWTPAFSRIAGLVLETGGVLAHGASLCREYGLPCVSAVDSACRMINTGDVIYIDGGSGTVALEVAMGSDGRSSRSD